MLVALKIAKNRNFSLVLTGGRDFRKGFRQSSANRSNQGNRIKLEIGTVLGEGLFVTQILTADYFTVVI